MGPGSPANRLPGRRVAVISPHLDDAVLSLGAAVYDAVSGGAEAGVVTVFAGVPGSDRPAAEWDRRAGFATVGDATAARREEDRRACEVLGARAVHLSFDEDDPTTSDDTVTAAVLEAVEGADLMLFPGHPLTHPTHARVTRLALANAKRLPPQALYLEQPYALWVGSAPPARADASGPELSWRSLPPTRGGAAAKRKAVRAYRSQLRLLSSRTPIAWKLRLYERRNGGEQIALIGR